MDWNSGRRLPNSKAIRWRLPKRVTPKCGARTRKGTPCEAPAWRPRATWAPHDAPEMDQELFRALGALTGGGRAYSLFEVVRAPARPRRCRMHGGLSTGPRTAEGKARCRAAALRNLEAARAALARKRADRSEQHGYSTQGARSEGAAASENTAGNSGNLGESGSTGSTESAPAVDLGGEAIAALQLSEAVQFGPHVLRSVAGGRNGVQAIEPRDAGAVVRFQSGAAVLIVWSVVTWADLEATARIRVEG